MRYSLAIALLIALAGCKQRDPARHESGPAVTAEPAASEAVAVPSALPTLVVPVDPPTGAKAPAALPQEVVTLGERIAMCEHFAGEEAYDAERGKFIRERVEQTCPDNAKTLARLQQKYAGNAAAAAYLAKLQAPDM